MINQPPICIIQDGKQKSIDLADAVIAGYGAGEILVAPRYNEIPAGYTPVVIGPHPTTVDAMRHLHMIKRPYVTVDNGYYRPYKEGGYFRMTTNAMQWIGSRPTAFGRAINLPEGRARFEALDLQVLPQRDAGDGPILIVEQSSTWMHMMGMSAHWTQAAIDKIEAYTDRRIIVRHKPLKGTPAQPPLAEQLKDASAVVGFTSAALIHGAMAGVPIYALGYCAASPMAHPILDIYINDPKTYPRLPYLHDLAANQWTIEEIASGRAWKDLAHRYQPDFMRPA